MAKSQLQKQKLLRVYEFLQHHADEQHPASTAAIIAHLEHLGIASQRKAIYDDIETLRECGIDVVQTNIGRLYGYYLGARTFELPELKLLVDSVQASKFISPKKTDALIRKLETLTSEYDAQQLQRQVFVHSRAKTENESVLYSIDALHAAIFRDRKVRFRYYDLNLRREKVFRKNGTHYSVSPCALVWDDENYYLVAYDDDSHAIRHYRVDKMTELHATDIPRSGQEVFARLDLGLYAKSVFGMFGGETAPVKLRFENRFAHAVFDRLGRDAMLIPDGDTHFTVTAEITVSPQFFAWLFGFGSAAKLLGPPEAVAALRQQLADVAGQYGST